MRRPGVMECDALRRTRRSGARRYGLRHNTALGAPAMADIRKIIQTTLEGPSFHLRVDAYRPVDAQELISDILSLANSPLGGKRYIVFGVESMPGSTERRVPGISETPNVQMWQHLVREYIEPDVRIEYRTETLADRMVGV